MFIAEFVLAFNLVAAVPALDPPELSFVEIAGQPAGETQVSLEDQPSGTTVTVDCWACPPNPQVWILVTLRESAKTRGYGPGKNAGNGRVTIWGVRFGEATEVGRYYAVYAVLLGGPPPAGDADLAAWLAKAEAVSGPKRVRVLARSPSGNPGIRIGRIDGLAADSREPIPVQYAVNVDGALAMPQGTGSVALLVCAVATDRCRVIRNAYQDGGTFRFVGARLAEAGATAQTTYDLIAIVEKTSIGSEYLRQDEWPRYALIASPPVRVIMGGLPPPLPHERPEIRVTQIVTSTFEKVPVPAQGVVELGSECIVEVGGSVEGLRLSSSVTLLIDTLDGQLAVAVAGSLLGGNRWSARLHRFALRRACGARRISVAAIASLRPDPPPLLPEDLVVQYRLAASPTCWITRTGPLRSEPEPQLAIGDYAGLPMSAEMHGVPASGVLHGSLEGYPEGTRVCAAIRSGDAGDWVPTCVPAQDDGWSIPLRLPQSGAGAHVRVFAAELCPPDSIPSREMDLWAAVSSPLYLLKTDSKKENLSMQKLIWFAALLGSIVAIVLAWYRGRGRSAMHAGRAASGPAAAYLIDRVPWVRSETFQPRALLGLLLYAIGLAGMRAYFPVYRHALAKLFVISTSIAGSVALTLILFNAAAGILLEMATHGDEAPREKANAGGGAGQYLLITVLLLINLCLWSFQAFAYWQFYLLKTGDPARAATLALAGFYIAALETMMFWYGTKYGWNLIALVLVGLTGAVVVGLSGLFRVSRPAEAAQEPRDRFRIATVQSREPLPDRAMEEEYVHANNNGNSPR